ncbi:MAG: membrane dipeptidase [Candidatus Doudnabacteria bacterium]|nr:membrane dipeptidase [Candidatus Doudnabacteria bacterium]
MICIQGFDRSFVCVDAHLDQHDPTGGDATGGWGSNEQLQDMGLLEGALRVFFCETLQSDGETRSTPPGPDEHLVEVGRIRDTFMPPFVPDDWRRGVHFRYHVEGMESCDRLDDAKWLIDRLHEMGVRGFNPIYHPDNPLGGCSKESGKGLTELGRRVFTYAWAKGWWVDTAHMSDTSIAETLTLRGDRRDWKLCYTHGGIQHDGIDHSALVNGNIERCLTMDRALEIVRAGGLVCLSPAKPFYPGFGGVFVDHVRALLAETRMHWCGVGIGTDYGGILDDWRFDGCETVGRLFEQLIVALLGAGLTELQVRRVVGANAGIFFDLTEHSSSLASLLL